jgi:transcriptional regulator with XRE-family HTH domain
MKIGEKIKLARLKRNYTQEGVAHMLGISATAYRNIEKKDNISLKRFEEILKALQMTEEEILSIEERIYPTVNGNNNIVNSQIYDTKSLLFQIEKKNLELEKKDLEIANLKLQVMLAEEKLKNIDK